MLERKDKAIRTYFSHDIVPLDPPPILHLANDQSGRLYLIANEVCKTCKKVCINAGRCENRHLGADKEELDKLLAKITLEYLSILRQKSTVKMHKEEEEIPIESDEMIETRPIPQIS